MTMRNTPLTELIAFIKRNPSVKGNVSSGFYDEGFWWIKCAVDIEDPVDYRKHRSGIYIRQYERLA